MTMPPDEAAKLSAFMLDKAQSRRDLLFKIALIGGGVFGVGALLWFFFRPKSNCEMLKARYNAATTAQDRTAILGEASKVNCPWATDVFRKSAEEAYAQLGGVLPTDSATVRAAKIAQARADEAAQIARAQHDGFGGL